ncbi:uncharacterized protein A1O9_08605 [Exophiala aquamarina CBS 119918]|uniref:Uncharacterized protein n=1 Tax=Exophiala aquamarina CBS 119918 TaxID=1182545 RepID=A0A072P6N7_9EURO|nr:uncharacterized protein A1O9_08605 [Exophiala aquamarina CBS 119918]KEF54953.1 hypothetical protein A1O9_08605 [Exophiala aquamarina CBS 119918]
MNISRIGHTNLFNTSDGDGSILGDLANDIQGDINNLISDVGSNIANALDLPDFFLIYLTGYCKGMYRPNATILDPTNEIIGCSNHTALFHFKPTAITDSYFPNSTTLEDLH